MGWVHGGENGGNHIAYESAMKYHINFFAVLAIIYNWCNNNDNNNSMFTFNQGNRPVTHFRNVFQFFGQSKYIKCQ